MLNISYVILYLLSVAGVDEIFYGFFRLGTRSFELELCFEFLMSYGKKRFIFYYFNSFLMIILVLKILASKLSFKNYTNRIWEREWIY